jgi:exodeoxyribonuclease-3
MKIATYNVNGINGRLLVLLRWLALAKADIVCLWGVARKTASTR